MVCARLGGDMDGHQREGYRLRCSQIDEDLGYPLFTATIDGVEYEVCCRIYKWLLPGGKDEADL